MARLAPIMAPMMMTRRLMVSLTREVFSGAVLGLELAWGSRSVAEVRRLIPLCGWLIKVDFS